MNELQDKLLDMITKHGKDMKELFKNMRRDLVKFQYQLDTLDDRVKDIEEAFSEAQRIEFEADFDPFGDEGDDF